MVLVCQCRSQLQLPRMSSRSSHGHVVVTTVHPLCTPSRALTCNNSSRTEAGTSTKQEGAGVDVGLPNPQGSNRRSGCHLARTRPYRVSSQAELHVMIVASPKQAEQGTEEFSSGHHSRKRGEEELTVGGGAQAGGARGCVGLKLEGWKQEGDGVASAIPLHMTVDEDTRGCRQLASYTGYHGPWPVACI